MKRTILLSIGILFLLSVNAFPQAQLKPEFYRNQVGVQFNPLINDWLLNSGSRMIQTVAAIRYGYRITKNFTAGTEFDCHFPIFINCGDQYHIFNYFSYGINLFTRYSVLTEKRFQIFAEVSPYFSHYYKEVWISGDPNPYRSDKFGCYAAPGVTLYSKSRRISFDLYSEFDFTGHTRLSYKVNYNF